jgi:hypothetical protein
MFRRAAEIVGQILSGAKPGDKAALKSCGWLE